MKNLLIFICVFMLIACSESNNSGSSATQLPNLPNLPIANGSPDAPNIVPLAKLDLVAEVSLMKDSKVQVQAMVSSLLNDDAIYIHIESAEIDDGTLRVEPQNSIIYPTNNTANLYLLFADNGLINDATVNVRLVTASGQIVINELQVKVGQ
jgi:hypothetical protein